MNRFEVLEKASGAVTQRQENYGSPEDNARRIADMWSAFLGMRVEPWQVGPMMALLKLARLASDHKHVDSWVDLAGYAAYGGEVALSEATTT